MTFSELQAKQINTAYNFPNEFVADMRELVEGAHREASGNLTLTATIATISKKVDQLAGRLRSIAASAKGRTILRGGSSSPGTHQAVTYFRNQGFNKHEILTDPKRWVGCIKDSDGVTLMDCRIHPNFDCLRFMAVLQDQREFLREKTGIGPQPAWVRSCRPFWHSKRVQFL
jgi:hypothetical protein